MKRIALFALALVLVAGIAAADDPKARAKVEYSRGLAAHDARDYRAAARAFADADAILPSANALSAALDDAMTADDPLLGSELLERAKRPGSTASLAQSVAAAQKKFAGRATKIRLVCPSDATCSANVDDRPLVTELWIAPGMHTLTTTVNAEKKTRSISVRADEPIEIALEKPAPAAAPPPPAPAPVVAPPASEPAPPPPKRGGVSPVFVYAGGGLAVVLGGVAVVTGVIAKQKHDDFEQQSCAHTLTYECQSLHDKGLPLVIATNALLAGAILSAGATTVIGIACTNWHPSAAPTTGGFVAGLQGVF